MMINPLDLTGKKVLIAGVSSEIGRTIVLHILDLGAQVFMVDNSAAILEEISNHVNKKVLFRCFDIYDNEAIEKNLIDVINQNGPLDGFVYSAGLGGVKPLSFTKNDFLSEMMNANLYSFVEIVRCISMKKRMNNGGSIVAISSVSSIKGLKSKTAYCASKAALDSAIRSIAAELSGKRIRINSVMKGWVTSDMKLDFIQNNTNLNSQDFERQLLGPIEPIEIANTVSFLLSDSTKSITGTAILIDGGYTL